MGEAHFREIPLMGSAPEDSATVMMSVPQQHRLELLACFKARSDCILAGAGEIAHGFIALIGDEYRGQLGRAGKAG